MMEKYLTMTSLIFLLIALASMLTHGVKKWVNGEIQGDLIDWYLVHPRASIGAVMACIGGVMVAILTGTLTAPIDGTAILAAWGLGYGADTLNSQGTTKDG
jgi:hypothetical protein